MVSEEGEGWHVGGRMEPESVLYMQQIITYDAKL
jgi:hypothetical protein